MLNLDLTWTSPELETLQAQTQSEASGLILLTIHDWLHGLDILVNDGHLTVSLTQHAPVIDIGRTWWMQYKFFIMIKLEKVH